MENQGPIQTPPKNWLVESILVTIFCCLPFGIVGIINASKVNSAFAVGDMMGAQKASDDAKKWVRIGFIVGIVMVVISSIAYGSFFYTLMQNPEMLEGIE